MSNSVAALRAAKEVQADVLAPELFREARDNFFKGKREYRMKNFEKAREFIERARLLAERAEFESLKNGGNRNATPPDPFAEPASDPKHGSAPVAKPPKPEEPAATQKQIYYESYESNPEKYKDTPPPPAPGLTPTVQMTQDPYPNSNSPRSNFQPPTNTTTSTDTGN